MSTITEIQQTTKCGTDERCCVHYDIEGTSQNNQQKQIQLSQRKLSKSSKDSNENDNQNQLSRRLSKSSKNENDNQSQQQQNQTNPNQTQKQSVIKNLSWMDRLLSVWIILIMILGVVVGYFTDISQRLGVVDIDKVSLPIAIGLWLMMWPVLCKVRYENIYFMFKKKQTYIQIFYSLVANWVVGPLIMLGLAWATLPDLPYLRNGVILVGIARCIAMVLIWNQLAQGHREYCAILVAVNSIIQIVLYAPFALLYLQVISRQYLSQGLHISFWDVFRSVLIYLGGPLVAAVIFRYIFIYFSSRDFFEKKVTPYIGPIAMLALLWTIFAMFALQGHKIIANIGNVFRVVVPLVIYFGIMWSCTFLSSLRFKFNYEFAVTQSFTAASNNFELAIAIATGTFGIQSDEALAATIGPLVEVPVLLGLVYVSIFIRNKFKLK